LGRAEKRRDGIASQAVSPNPAEGAHHAIVNALGVLGKQNRADQVVVEPAHGFLVAESKLGGNMKWSFA
jgi:hypothetical protein